MITKFEDELKSSLFLCLIWRTSSFYILVFLYFVMIRRSCFFHFRFFFSLGMNYRGKKRRWHWLYISKSKKLPKLDVRDSSISAITGGIYFTLWNPFSSSGQISLLHIYISSTNFVTYFVVLHFKLPTKLCMFSIVKFKSILEGTYINVIEWNSVLN